MNEEITSWFNTQIFAGINSIMHDAGYDISVFQHIDTADMRRKFFTDLPVRRNVDAVFVASFAIDEKEVEQLKRIRVPIIGINTPSIDGFDASISIDDENGMYTATQHLLNLGHKHIVYACSAASESMDSSIDARGADSSAPAKTSRRGVNSTGRWSPCRADARSPIRRCRRCSRWTSSPTPSAAR